MKFTCPHCQTQLECDDSFAGSTADCPKCGKPLVIQTPPPPNPLRIVPASSSTAKSKSATDSPLSSDTAKEWLILAVVLVVILIAWLLFPDAKIGSKSLAFWIMAAAWCYSRKLKKDKRNKQ